MQENMEMNSPNGSNHNPNVENLHASEFMALSSEKQMFFVASTLVRIESDVSKLKKG